MMNGRNGLCSLILVVLSAIASANTIPPLAVGNRWEYSVAKYGVMSFGEGEASRSAPMSAKGTCIEEVISVKEQRKDGPVYEYRSTTKMEAGVRMKPSTLIEDMLMQASKSGILVLASKARDLGDKFSDEWEKYDPSLILYASDMKPGTKWKVGTVREDNLRMPMEAEVVGTESVTVPAGTFPNCLKLYVTCSRVTGTVGSGAELGTFKSGKSISTVWIDPDVGSVKEDLILQATMEFPNGPPMTATERKIKELLPGFRAE